MTVLPELPWAPWQPTLDTLHLYCQIVGKVKLVVSPFRNHWWHVTLLPSGRGLTTGPIRRGDRTFEVRFDFVDHALVATCSDGASEHIALRDGLSVAAFDRALHGALDRLGLGTAIDERPFGTPISDVPFPEDETHASYDADAVERFWRATDWVAGVLEEFAGRFVGKQSPVHLFWHSFDLAMARYSGRRAPEMDADRVTCEAYSHEVVAFGFWPGDAVVTQPAFYSYTAPEPQGLTGHPLAPREARWTQSGTGHIGFLAYDDVRAAEDPRGTLLAFLESGYRAGAAAARWDTAALEHPAPPA